MQAALLLPTRLPMRRCRSVPRRQRLRPVRLAAGRWAGGPPHLQRPSPSGVGASRGGGWADASAFCPISEDMGWWVGGAGRGGGGCRERVLLVAHESADTAERERGAAVTRGRGASRPGGQNLLRHALASAAGVRGGRGEGARVQERGLSGVE